MATPATLPPGSLLDEKMKKSSPGKIGAIAFGIMLIGGVGYIASRLWTDLAPVHEGSVFPYILLGVALLIALGFDKPENVVLGDPAGNSCPVNFL